LGSAAQSLLYGVSPTDTATYLAVPAFLMAVSALACMAPARRAAALSPTRALRHE
jgi:putative ABC transport system permease protein